MPHDSAGAREEEPMSTGNGNQQAREHAHRVPFTWEPLAVALVGAELELSLGGLRLQNGGIGHGGGGHSGHGHHGPEVR